MDWAGLEIAEGRYQIQGTIGSGSMGQIYSAFDRHLDTTVVLKFPVTQELPAGNQAGGRASAARSAGAGSDSATPTRTAPTAAS